MTNIIIKDWFLDKKFTQDEKYAISVSDVSIIGESEKAVKLKFESDYGNIFSWIPKSCLMTEEEIAEKQRRFEEGCERYEQMLDYAKSLGCKGVRRGMKLWTIENKINEALAAS